MGSSIPLLPQSVVEIRQPEIIRFLSLKPGLDIEAKKVS